jgi:hypothetical protein
MISDNDPVELHVDDTGHGESLATAKEINDHPETFKTPDPTPNPPSLPTQSKNITSPTTTQTHPPHLTILTLNSLAPLTLPIHLLTTHSRLFATLSHDPATFSQPTLHLNIDHDTFTVFARWLRGGKIHLPEGDENGFATDLYVLMRAHAAGEALGAGVFADMCLDEIIGELTMGEDGQRWNLDCVKSEIADARAKTHDLEILLQAAAAIWPPGSLGRDLLVEWYVHSSSHTLQNLSVSAVVEIGDLDIAARCMVLGKERQMLVETGEFVEAPYLVDPCRYHEHRRLGQPCYKQSRDSVFSHLELIVRSGVGGWEDDDDWDSGFEGEVATPEEYRDCVRESLMVLEGRCELMS